MDYNEYTDEELIELYRDGDSAVPDFIMVKYKNLVRKHAGTMFILGADKEDLIQEGMIGLLKAIRDYDSGRDASFMTFADLCVSRQMYTAVKNSGRKKHAPLNGYISLYANEGEGSEVSPLIGAIEAGEITNPERIVIDQENVERIWALVDELGSPLEKSVFELYVIGMTGSQIARVLSRDQKSTDNALGRIKSKLKARLYDKEA